MKDPIVYADTAIIGAGVVGCAIAREISRQYPNKKIMVLEKLSDVGMETSSRNSGVLHSGLHQDPKFLKSRLAQEGSKMAAEYITRAGLPILSCGMIIAVPSTALKEGLWREWRNLWSLIKKGRAQGIKFKFLTPLGLRKLEPNLKALGGIFIPNVWIIDSVQFTRLLYHDTKANGVQFSFQSPVTNIYVDSRTHSLLTPWKRIIARTVINAAGLYADDIARLAGFPNYKIYPWRGEYYEVISEKKKAIRRLVYPVVPANYPGKGIHFSPRVDGRLFIGPNARPVPTKNYYHEDATPIESFLRIAQRFYPDLKAEDLRWGYSGIRPKLTNVAEESDFLIKMDRQSPTWINLIGIESPGLAASMAIGKHVTEMLKGYL